MLSRDMRTF